MKVKEAQIGDVIDIKDASENPCIKTGNSVIDRWVVIGILENAENLNVSLVKNILLKLLIESLCYK